MSLHSRIVSDSVHSRYASKEMAHLFSPAVSVFQVSYLRERLMNAGRILFLDSFGCLRILEQVLHLAFIMA